MLWNFRPNVPRGTFPLPFDAFHFVFHVKHVDTDANSDSSFHVELSSECVWILLGKEKRLRPRNVPRGTLGVFNRHSHILYSIRPPDCSTWNFTAGNGPQRDSMRLKHAQIKLGVVSQSQSVPRGTNAPSVTE
jgi:hypothetical protein